MNARRLAIATTVLVALSTLSLASCETYPAVPTPTPPLGPRLVEAADALHAQAATMEAEATRQARATRDALDVAARGTADALAAAGTAQALTLQATQAAWAFQATTTAVAAQAAATAQAAQATGTAQVEAAHATATAQAAALQVEQTAQAAAAFKVEATRQAVERQAQRERSTQAFKTYGPWALLALAVALAIVIGYDALPVLLARWRVIRRKAGEGEPLVMLERGADGSERIALPLRSFWHVFDAGATPEAPTPELQDRAAGRQQLANVMLALSGGRSGKKQRTARRLPTSRQPQSARLSPGAIEVVEPERVQPWIEDVETQLLEEVNR
jgi:chemotaxis protein histidine kinase CheA